MNCSFAHLSWVTWANHSLLLIFHERPEWFAHGRSFVLSDLSDLLTVAYLSRAIWANCSQSLIWFERNERTPSPGAIVRTCANDGVGQQQVQMSSSSAYLYNLDSGHLYFLTTKSILKMYFYFLLYFLPYFFNPLVPGDFFFEFFYQNWWRGALHE